MTSKKHPFYLLLLIFHITFSCTEDYRLPSLDNTNVFTVDGCITNEMGPYLIRLAEYKPDWSGGDTLELASVPVTEARVRITDDAGNMDELMPLWKEQIEAIPVHNWRCVYYILMPTYQNNYERVPLSRGLSDLALYEGVYCTTSISGVPDRTYTLTVEHNDKTYTATDHMSCETVLDSVVMRPNGTGEYKGDGFHVPYLYFPVPQGQENYYFFPFLYVDSSYNSSIGKNDLPVPRLWNSISPVDIDFSGRHNWVTWNMIPVNDRFMSPYMADHKMGAGTSSSTFFGWYRCGIWFKQYRTHGYIHGFHQQAGLPVSEGAYRSVFSGWRRIFTCACFAAIKYQQWRAGRFYGNIGICLQVKLFQRMVTTMEKKIYYCILSILFVAIPLQAQQHRIYGTIRDAATGKTLSDATVAVEGKSSGVASNAYGYYSLSLPRGEYRIRWSYIGYAVETRTINLTGDFAVDIVLHPEATGLSEVAVTASQSKPAPAPGVNVKRMTIAEIRRMPAFLAEPYVLCSLQTLPGVQVSHQGSVNMSVRGDSYSQNLVLLDEAPVFNPSHVLGFMSSFNPDAVSTVDLYKGVPVRYGSMLSSVVDIRMKESDRDRFGATGGIGVVASRLAVEGPLFDGRCSYILAGRYCYAGTAYRTVSGLLENSPPVPASIRILPYGSMT